MTNWIKWRGDYICENYFVMVNGLLHSGELKWRGRRVKVLKFHRCTYLPDQPRACVLDDPGMWATTTQHEERVCAGCGMKLSELGVSAHD
jgi:hypothetical protein